jgi:hypothetical protein
VHVQVRSKEEELTNLRSQLSVSREAAERRIGELEGRCIRWAAGWLAGCVCDPQGGKGAAAGAGGKQHAAAAGWGGGERSCWRQGSGEHTCCLGRLPGSRIGESPELGALHCPAGACRLAEANRQLEIRRQLDADGWQSDITLLRKSLAAVDRKLLQMRLIDRWGAPALLPAAGCSCGPAPPDLAVFRWVGAGGAFFGRVAGWMSHLRSCHDWPAPAVTGRLLGTAGRTTTSAWPSCWTASDWTLKP